MDAGTGGGGVYGDGDDVDPGDGVAVGLSCFEYIEVFYNHQRLHSTLNY